MLASAIVLGLFNMVGKWAGARPYVGIPSIGRVVLFFALTIILDIFVVPSPEKLERNNNPMPPLPDMNRVEAPAPPPRPVAPPAPPQPEPARSQVARPALEARAPESDAHWQRPASG